MSSFAQPEDAFVNVSRLVSHHTMNLALMLFCCNCSHNTALVQDAPPFVHGCLEGNILWLPRGKCFQLAVIQRLHVRPSYEVCGYIEICSHVQLCSHLCKWLHRSLWEWRDKNTSIKYKETAPNESYYTKPTPSLPNYRLNGKKSEHVPTVSKEQLSCTLCSYLHATVKLEGIPRLERQCNSV